MGKCVLIHVVDSFHLLLVYSNGSFVVQRPGPIVFHVKFLE